MFNKDIIIIIVLIILILIILFIYKSSESLNYNNIFNNHLMSRPNCAQLNDYNICDSTPGCRYINQSKDNIDLAVAGNMPGVGGQGCINHYEDLRDVNIPEWENDNFMIIRD